MISDYVSHNAHGQAASVLSTVIANRRSMCVTGQDLNIFVLTTYANAVAGLVAEHIDYCTSSKGHAANWNDYEGILTTALALIHSCENDADIQPEVVANALDTLNSAQYDLRKQALLSSTFGKDPKPTQLQIDAGLETYLQDLPPVVAAASSSASASGKPEPLGCAIALFLLAGVILMDLNTQNGATRVMMIIFCAVLVIAGIVMWLSRRKE